MKSRDEFIDLILRGSKAASPTGAAPSTSALPDGFDGFDTGDVETPAQPGASSFARRLLEGSAFELAKLVETQSLIRSKDAVAKFLPERAAYWPKTQERPFQTILFEALHTNKDLQAIPAFKGHSIAHLEIVEDALARLANEALEGFQHRGAAVTADVLTGKANETLCVVSILDERDGKPVRLVCFATENQQTGSLETFQITEAVRSWDPQLARDHLGLFWERQFKKLGGAGWQEAFTTSEERQQAERLLQVCTRKTPEEKDIQEAVLDLLDTIAKGFGLRKKPNARRLQAYTLPADHDIGIDSEERESKFGGRNPFSGVTLRDEKSRLLGYIVYPLKTKQDAVRLRKHLADHNRFHNVLVVYPDTDQATLELWQGRDQLIGKLRKGHEPKEAANVVSLLSRFFVVSKAKVKNPTELAQELAYRARYLRLLAVKELREEDKNEPLRKLYTAFKEALVHDQTEEEFADAFAQTLTYGLLTARWLGNEQAGKDAERFTRQTALKLLPATSPFLNDLFRSALSLRLDEQRGRLLWLVDDIADLLDRVDVVNVFRKGDADSDSATDPVIHFYEPFLAAYDRDLKNKRGVFFTPRPVVSYIVRSVHDILQTEFGLDDGLASTETWGQVTKRLKGLTLPAGVKEADPFVCVLDPATGTGTFLYECIEVIERTMKDRWCRELGAASWTDPRVLQRWIEYVPNGVLSRLYGYELMMAPYAIAHLKLAFKLSETGYKTPATRLNVYLTNSLDPPSTMANPKLAGLFEALSVEAQTVNDLKRHKRFTIVVGNPPYSLLSSNLDANHRDLVEPYKFINGERIKEKGALQLEKNLNDDYVKFLRLTQRSIEQSHAGVVGMITNHSFLDNPTMRGARWSLTRSASQLWFVDLHGNSTKQERTPDGTPDENVFQIKQGVAISLLVSTGCRGTDVGGVVKHCNLWGLREAKERWLVDHSMVTTEWGTVDVAAEHYLFVPQVGSLRAEFGSMSSLPEIMPVSGAGYITARDGLVVEFDREVLAERITRFAASRLDDEALLREFDVAEKKGWDVARARRELRQLDIPSRILRTNYRPFDARWIFFDGSLVWGRSWPTMQHLIPRPDNLSLIATRMTKDKWDVSVSRTVSSHKAMSAYDTNSVFPLFLYTDSESRQHHLERRSS